MTDSSENRESAQTFGELMGFHRYESADFKEGDCFFIDQARAQEAKQNTPILRSADVKTYGMLLAERHAVVLEFVDPLQKTA